MASKLVVQHTCSRCPREWYENYTEGQPVPKPSAIDLTFIAAKGKAPVKIKFDSLCDTCSSTIEGYLDLIGKLVKNKSPHRTGAKKKAPHGPSSNPAD